uniref:MSP domain-containing protein n=1 Tax=Panagrolaimus sp. ES5 TaxID=591445 RepID=A0AC34FWS2_9BILA
MQFTVTRTKGSKFGLELQRHTTDGEAVVIVSAMHAGSLFEEKLKVLDILSKVDGQGFANVKMWADVLNEVSKLNESFIVDIKRPISPRALQYCRQQTPASSGPVNQSSMQKSVKKELDELSIIRPSVGPNRITVMTPGTSRDIQLVNQSSTKAIASKAFTSKPDILSFKPIGGIIKPSSSICVELTRNIVANGREKAVFKFAEAEPEKK